MLEVVNSTKANPFCRRHLTSQLTSTNAYCTEICRAAHCSDRCKVLEAPFLSDAHTGKDLQSHAPSGGLTRAGEAAPRAGDERTCLHIVLHSTLLPPGLHQYRTWVAKTPVSCRRGIRKIPPPSLPSTSRACSALEEHMCAAKQGFQNICEVLACLGLGGAQLAVGVQAEASDSQCAAGCHAGRVHLLLPCAELVHS